jgi:hypothetical protein
MIVNKENYNIEHFKNSKLVNHPENDGKPIDKQHFKGEHLQLERTHHIKESLKQISIEGEVLEFGVHKGQSINVIAEIINKQIVHGFDSFEGLPEDWPIWHRDKLDPQNIKHKKGYFAVDTLPEVKENVKLWKGWFEDTIPQYIKQQQPKQIAFLHVDGDLYSSAKTNLFQLEKYIVKDTIICFDELYAFGRKPYETWEEGEYKALKEWTTKFNREFEVLSHNLHQQSTIRIVK